jgi:16S rRNA (guanine966-N2)-methyltransferase
MQRGRNTRELRVIGGRWRGRKWRFPAAAGIRPTPDRVRETLFNWLMGHVAGAACLDLFAGSGALGLEALSRGAQSVTFVDSDRRATEALRAILDAWHAEGSGTVVAADALKWLETRRSGAESFDVAFVDPPFASGLSVRACELLESRAALLPGALIYLEAAADVAAPLVPAGWQRLKAKRAGQVGYYLFERSR